MSDFFTRLAERTLGLALIIQPIKPSLFAPQPDFIGETPLEITEERMDTDVGTHTDARQPFTDVTPAPEAMSYASVDMPINSVNDPHPHDRPNPHQSVDHRREPERELVSPQMAHARTFMPVIHEVEVQAQQSRTSSQLFAQSQTHAELHNEASLPRHVGREHDSGVSSRNDTSGSANTSGTHIETAEVLETSALVHEQTVSRHVFLSERRRSPQLSVPPSPAQVQLEATTSEPTIQVTIGRVEVRAVSAPPTTTRSQQQPARPSAMSLDEYLRQQQGGRR